MQSSTSQHKAIELATEAINDLNKTDHVPLKSATTFVWKCMQYPGQLLDKVRTSGVGKTLVGIVSSATAGIVLRRIYDYMRGATNNPMEVFAFPRQRTMATLTNAPRRILRRHLAENHLIRMMALAPRAGAYSRRLFSPWSKSFRKYNRQKVFIPTSHKFTVPSYVKTGAAALGAVSLGTLGLKYAGRFFRKLFHRN